MLTYHYFFLMANDSLFIPVWFKLPQIVSCETDGNEIDTLKDIGLQIVAKCDGLPLAIKVLGGLLCQKEKKRHEWKMVLDDSIWSANEMPEELNHAVYLSYEDLPSCIKQCLLYYSLLPKTALFYKHDIIGMWIGEGFVHETSDNLEELGSKYYKELIVRNLIEPNAKYLDQIVCSMHDVVRSFAQFVSRDEALAAHSGETNIRSKISAYKFLRLSLENKSWESDGLDWSSLQTQTMLRTLILVGNINMKSGDLLAKFSSLRTLYADSTGVGELAEFLHQFKHLRYLCLENSDIASLPDNLGQLKFLQFISLCGSKQFVELPHSIVQLSQLRYLNFHGTSICGIPKGFCVLTNLRIVFGFPAVEDGDWCSLEELGPLYQLTDIGLQGLENVTAPSSAAKAKLGEKVHLTTIRLRWHSRLGDDGKIKEEDSVSEEEQEKTEKVFDELCPPPNIDFLIIRGYFGRRLPTWMMSSTVVSLKTLRSLMIEDLACCTLLPDGLCQLQYLEFIQIKGAPSIKRVGLEFLQSNHHQSMPPSHVPVAFPKVHTMNLTKMVEWEEWEWEEQVQAFPVLRELLLKHCKLTSLPPGLSSQAKALNTLMIHFVQGLTYVASFASVVRMEVGPLPDLVRITNLPRLQILRIIYCPKLKVLEGVPALQTLMIDDKDMETLPKYMRGISPMCLELYCSLALLYSIAAGPSGPEWDKFSHIEHVKVYAREGDMVKKWYVLYTANPYNLETNVSRSFMSAGTLSCFEDAQRFESVFKMTRKTFDYISSLVFGPSLEDMNSYTFVDGRVLCLEDRVAVALIRLYSSGPSESLGSSVGVSESTVLLVAEKFVDAVLKRAAHHLRWPDSSKMDKIKSTFGKIHNLHNCCGIICTTHIPFGPNCDHGENGRILMQAVIDPKMRFMSLALNSRDSITQLSILHESPLFKECEKGGQLNDSKLKVASYGSEVGEYLIGDAGYPLLPWLLTPYQEENLSDPKAEFNRRHFAATACARKALAMLQEKWKCLQKDVWWPENLQTRYKMIDACCRLHNIVMDMEDDEGMPSAKGWNYHQQVRLVAKEDAVRARDMLSQYFLTRRSFESGGTLSCFGDAQRFEYVFKMTRKTFDYICSLVKVPSLEDMDSYTFVDGRILCLEDRVAVALIRLYSNEPSETLGSSFGVHESTIKLVTDSFIAAICKGAMHHMYWPHSSKMDKIKSRFGKIHNMHNCCGVICTTHVPFGPTCDHEKNVSILMRAIVDPEMRFMEIWLEWEGSMNWSSDLQGCDLFKECEEGVYLNGSKLKVALDGSEVGEYLIGDAGYPLLPWLLTPYPEEDLSDSRAEFNSRHSAATTRLTKVLARFQDTWKFLEGQTSCPANVESLAEAIYACCMLHNIFIDMENDEAMPGIEEPDYCEEVRQLADEDAAKARDMLSQYFWASMTSASGVGPVDIEDPGAVSSGSGDKGNNEQEMQTRTAEEERQC
ncbi:uncharacterized protein [Lolium perenne]|uniref:uncharacterized protein n=1 Tax=Lolium perenne TaxID=4522 RepID=UPI003A9A20D4